MKIINEVLIAVEKNEETINKTLTNVEELEKKSNEKHLASKSRGLVPRFNA